MRRRGSQSSQGHFGDALSVPCHRLPWAAFLWKLDLKPLLDFRLCLTSQVSNMYSLGTRAFHFRFCSPNTSCPLSPRILMLKDPPSSPETSGSHQFECVEQGPGVLDSP